MKFLKSPPSIIIDLFLYVIWFPLKPLYDTIEFFSAKLSIILAKSAMTESLFSLGEVTRVCVNFKYSSATT